VSDRKERPRTALWLIRRIDGSSWHLFSGDLREMVDYINELHRRSGVQHAPLCEA
jgi:hypothetical protein